MPGFRLIALALVSATVGLAASAAGADAQESASDARTYRIIAGTMTYDGSAERSGSYTNSSGHGVTWTATQRQRTVFAVHAPGAAAASSDVRAPLAVASWEHSFEVVNRFSETACSDAPNQTQTFSDSDLQHPGGISPSVFEAAVQIAPGAAPNPFEISLVPAAGPLLPTGLRWSDSERYPTILESERNTGPGECSNGPFSHRLSLGTRNPFDFHPDAPRAVETSPPRFGSSKCNAAGACITRVEGRTAWTYQTPNDGTTLSGSFSIDWSFDVEVAQPPCVGGFVAKDWDGFGQGDLANFVEATTPASSYGLAIRWCTKPNVSTTLNLADVRVVADRGGGFYHALGAALESITFDVSHRWVPDKSQKPKEKALPGGGLRVTAATGRFDVCVGLGPLIGGVARRAFKLLPKAGRKLIVRRFQRSASNLIEQAYKRDYKRIRAELVGKTDPKTGRTYTRAARKKAAERLAGDRRRVRYELLDFMAGQLIDDARFRGCLRAWEPKIVATISPDGSLEGIEETGYTRDWLWWVREADAETS